MAKWELVRNHLDGTDEDYPVLILDNENNRGDYWGWCGYAKINIPLAVVKGTVYKTVIDDLLVISTKEVDIVNSTKNVISFVDGEVVYFDPGFWIEYIHSKECGDLYRSAFLHNECPEIEGYAGRDEYDSEDEYQSEWWDALHDKYDDVTEDADELLQLSDIVDEVKIILE